MQGAEVLQGLGSVSAQQNFPWFPDCEAGLEASGWHPPCAPVRPRPGHTCRALWSLAGDRVCAMGHLPGSLHPTGILHAERQTLHRTQLPWCSDCSCPAWGLPG